MFQQVMAFSALFILAGCPSEIEKENFRAVVPYSLYPQVDTIGVGDTVWVEAFFSNVFTDVTSQESKVYSKSIWCRFPLSEISQSAPNGIIFHTDKKNYELIVSAGMPLPGEGIYVAASYADTNYHVKFGIKMLKPGTYVLFDDLGWGEENEVTFFQPFNNARNNDYLVPQSFTDVRRMLLDYNDEKATGVSNRAYCFYVK